VSERAQQNDCFLVSAPHISDANKDQMKKQENIPNPTPSTPSPRSSDTQ
jgi:hypothetical protein